jgi:hypothetical protein
MEGIGWDTVLAAAVGSSLTATIAVIVGVYFARRVIDQAVESAGKRYELTLQQALRAFESALQVGSRIDIDLRKRRMGVYKDLWRYTEILPKWPRDPGVTYEALGEFSKTLRTWYFRTGGMYLSKDAQKAYSDVQEKIRGILEEVQSGPIEDKHYDEVRDACSALRAQMTEDMLSRKPAPPQP